MRVYSSMAEQRTHNSLVVGSNPATRTKEHWKESKMVNKILIAAFITLFVCPTLIVLSQKAGSLFFTILFVFLAFVAFLVELIAVDIITKDELKKWWKGQ